MCPNYDLIESPNLGTCNNYCLFFFSILNWQKGKVYKHLRKLSLDIWLLQDLYLPLFTSKINKIAKMLGGHKRLHRILWLLSQIELNMQKHWYCPFKLPSLSENLSETVPIFNLILNLVLFLPFGPSSVILFLLFLTFENVPPDGLVFIR